MTSKKKTLYPELRSTKKSSKWHYSYLPQLFFFHSLSFVKYFYSNFWKIQNKNIFSGIYRKILFFLSFFSLPLPLRCSFFITNAIGIRNKDGQRRKKTGKIKKAEKETKPSPLTPFPIKFISITDKRQ